MGVTDAVGSHLIVRGRARGGGRGALSEDVGVKCESGGEVGGIEFQVVDAIERWTRVCHCCWREVLVGRPFWLYRWSWARRAHRYCHTYIHENQSSGPRGSHSTAEKPVAVKLTRVLKLELKCCYVASISRVP